MAHRKDIVCIRFENIKILPARFSYHQPILHSGVVNMNKDHRMKIMIENFILYSDYFDMAIKMGMGKGSKKKPKTKKERAEKRKKRKEKRSKR